MSTRKSNTRASHTFAQIPNVSIPRSQFNRSSGLKTAFDAGWLIPVFCDEALPGDTMNCRMTTFARLATPLHPILDNIYLDSFFFAVPIRLIWDNWEKMNGAQDDPGDSTTFLVPQMVSPASTGHAVGTLSDYIGIPTDIPDLTHSALWHRAYNLIYNEWFRDENLQDSITVDTDDGPDTVSDYSIRKRGKRHDYMTSCLPWPQKGTAVSLPLGTVAPVISTGDDIPQFKGAGTGTTRNLFTTGTDVNLNAAADTGSLHWENTKLEADLTNATAANINQLREAFQIQKIYERDARGGSRYPEIIKSHFGVTSSDHRLQRPEFLGGGHQTVSVAAVPQTSSTDGTSPQGNLAAYGISTGSNHTFVKSFTEHCVIIGLVCLRADLNYQQGLHRMFSRRTRWDFFWPAFAHLGEQSVLNKEIYAQGSLAGGLDDALTFGYQERYAEYRYKPSQITGVMRSTASGSLDTWHLAQEFSALPVLNSTFIGEDVPIDRIIATPADPHFLFDAYFDLKHARPMPTYSVPGLIDHF